MRNNPDDEQPSGLSAVRPGRAPGVIRSNRPSVPRPTTGGVRAPGVPPVTAPKVTSPSATSPTVKAVTPEPGQLPPLFSAGQTFLKGLLTSWAGSVGELDNELNTILKQGGKRGDDYKAFDAGAKNIQQLWGPTDVFQPGAWDELKTGETVLGETLGVKEKRFSLPNLPGAAAIAATSLFGDEEARRKGLGLFTGETEMPRINLGSNLLWGGLLIDIAADPLTYSPVLGPLSVLGKGANAGIRALVGGGSLAAAREVSENIVRLRGAKDTVTRNELNLGVSKGLQREGLQNVRDNIVAADPKAAKIVQRAEEKMANNVYKTVKVVEPRTLGEATLDVVGSAVDSAVKAVKNVYVSANATKFLKEYAKRDVKRGRNLTIVANVAKNPDTGLFDVLSGNKVKLGEAATEAEAKTLAKQLQEGLEPATQLTPAGTITGAKQGAGEAEDALTLPAEDGTEVSIQPFVPHQADNGMVYVYDGDNVAEFENMIDAGEWVNIITSQAAREAVEPVVSGSKGKYQVRVGERVTSFTTKRDATAYAEGLRTGQVPGVPTATRGGNPLIDTTPPAVPMKEILEAPATKEASALKAVLDGIDKVASKASGWRSLVNKSVANQIRQILSETQAGLDNLLMKLSNEQVNILREFVRQDLSAKEMFALLERSDNVGKALASTIKSLPVETTKGTAEFGELLAKAKDNFLNISKAVEGVEGNGLEAQIIKSIKVRFAERAQQLKTKAVLPSSTPEGKYQAIVSVAGEKIATKIQKTGYLTAKTPENRAKLNNILEQISIGTTEVSYAGYDDLIAGLQRGDEVSANVLEEIISLIDPQGMMKTAVVQASAEPAASYLTRLLTREGGVDTILEAERRLAIARDPAMLAKHSNLAYPAEVEAMMKMVETGEKPLIDGVEFASTKQAHAAAFEQYPENIQKDAMDSAGRSLMGNPKKGGTGGRQAYIRGIADEAGSLQTTSSLGDEIYRTAEIYGDGSRAAFAKQLSTSDEVRIISSLLGKRGKREDIGVAAAAEKGVEYDKLSGEGKLNYLIERMGAVRDGLGGFGLRFVRTKNRDDILFEKSYQAQIKAAKETDTTPNFSALSEKHTAYLPMVDILNALKLNDGTAALVKGYFPPGKVRVQRDTLDWYGLGDAARRVVEMDAAGEVFDVNEIAMRIARRGATREVPSGKRLEILREAANEIADVLTSPKVIAQLRGVHLDNAGSIIKDFVQKSEDYSKELFDILDAAWVNMHATDNISEAARMDNVRLFLRKFVLASDIMRLEGGPIAEAMFRASAMLFADGGKVLPAGSLSRTLTATEKEFYNLLREDELGMFREALTKWYRYADLPAAPIGREGMKPPAKAAKAKAQEALDTAMDVYAKHMDELAKIEATGDPQLIKAWEKDMKRFQARLDKARDDAWNKWVPTFHWHPTDGWVKTEQFDVAKATREAKQAYARYVAGKQGAADRELLMADTAPVIPPHRKLNAADKAKFLKQHREKMTEHSINNSASIIDDVARNVADEVDMGALNLDELSGPDKVMIAKQNMDARALKEATTLKLYPTLATYKVSIPSSPVEFNRLFRPLLDENTPVFFLNKVAAKAKLMSERWAATTRGGTTEAMMVYRQQENMATQRASDYGLMMENLVKATKKATQDDADAVWTALRDDLTLADDAPKAAQDLAKNLGPMVNATLKNEMTSVLVQNGLDGQAVGQIFARYGLDERIGFPSVKELNGKTAEELVENLLGALPFGSLPKKLNGEEVIEGSAEAIGWTKKRERFRASETPMALVFSRMFGAIQQLKAEQGIAHQFVAQFGWKTHYKTFEQAKAAGWVAMDVAAGQQNIARFLPSPEGGNLFHPVIAADMARVLRQWNDIYESNGLNAFLRGSMKFLGVVKSTQTTMRPGHHFVNILGDGSTALTATPISELKNAPIFAAHGFELANSFTKLNFEAEYSKFGRDFEAQGRRLVGAFAEVPGANMPTTEMAQGVKVIMYKNGKPTVTRLPVDPLAKDMGDRGAFVPGFVQADISGQANEIMLTGAGTGSRKSLQRIWSAVARPGYEVMRGLSTATAAYSNVLRGYTATRIMQSRAWSSYEEMMNAVIKEVNLLHPTVQSLASMEKRFGRLAFTYYTWLRQAHNALWDLAINNTAAMAAIPKFQYNYAISEGFDPQSPAVPFEDTSMLPDYQSYSVYGPSAMGAQGPRVYRPPLLLLDVLDFWKIYYDPSKPLDTNLLQMGGQLFGDVLGPSLNLLGRPILEATTGQGGGATSGGELYEDVVSNLGFTNLLVGLGLHTPYRYLREGTDNVLTEEDRKLRLENFMLGGRGYDLYRPVNQRIGRSQNAARVRDYNEITKQDNLQKINKFVNEKSSEGYSREQITEMLRQMGVNVK